MNGSQMDEIIAFLSVMDGGSFIRAGQLIGKDVSTISRRVSALEVRLDVRLIERSTRRLTPTEAGMALYERMSVAALAMEEGQQEIAQAGKVVKGLLRLALPATFGRLCIAPLLPEFLALHPLVSIEAEFADRYVDIIGERFDACIRIGELQDTRLVARRLMSNDRRVYASPEYLKLHGTPSTPAELEGHACLINSKFNGAPQWRFRRGEELASFYAKGALTADDPETLVQAAAAGMGITVCARWLVRSMGLEENLVPLLPDWVFDREGGINLMLPSGRFIPTKTRAFVDWLTLKFEDLESDHSLALRLYGLEVRRHGS